MPTTDQPPSRPQLSELQLQLMRVLWDRGEASTGEVHEALSRERELAYTTVATLLRRLEARGLVSHRRSGRQYRYRPRVSEARVRASMVSGLLDSLFQGDRAALVSHLLGDGEVSAEELAAVRWLLREGGAGND